MSRFKHWRKHTGGQIGVWLYKALNGRMSSGSKKVHVLMITTPGRRTGVPRSTCVRYIEQPDGYIVWGTGSGSKADPDWFRNLRKADVADMQIMAAHLKARPRELVGAER